MSRPGDFSWLNKHGLSNNQVQLYRTLAKYQAISKANGKDYAYPGQKVLVEEVGVSRRTISRDLTVLADAGLVVVQRRCRGNHYTLPETHIWMAPSSGCTNPTEDHPMVMREANVSQRPLGQDVPCKEVVLRSSSTTTNFRDRASRRSEGSRSSFRNSQGQIDDNEYGPPLEPAPRRTPPSVTPHTPRPGSAAALVRKLQEGLATADSHPLNGPWAGGSALRGTITRWIANGTTTAQIEEMIKIFLVRQSWKGLRREPWRLFIAGGYELRAAADELRSYDFTKTAVASDAAWGPVTPSVDIPWGPGLRHAQ